MKGITFSEFYDKLYYGADIDLCYNSVFYHINAGYKNQNLHSITVYEYDKHPNSKPSYYKEIYCKVNSNIAENINVFLNTAIFHSKTLNQVESDIIIIYS